MALALNWGCNTLGRLRNAWSRRISGKIISLKKGDAVLFQTLLKASIETEKSGYIQASNLSCLKRGK